MSSYWGAVVASVLITTLATVTVRAQEQVQCYSDSDVCSNDTVQPTLLTVEECCRGDGISFYNITEGACRVCIVFGFNQTSFTAAERGQEYTIQVDYIKGSSAGATVLGVDIEIEEITAVEGLGNDFTVDPTSFVFDTPFTAVTVRVNFRADAVALEPDETFRLTLSGGLPSGPNVFIDGTAEFTIIDGDVVRISFTDDDYGAAEPDLTMPVVVTKSHTIASDITLTVTPLTIAEAEAEGIQPPNVPPENPDGQGLEFTRANGAEPQDFNPTMLNITFTADEGVPGATQGQNISVPIPIIDDERDEPDEEVFAASLSITNVSNTVRPGALEIARNVCLCRIADDDPISIGFATSSFITNDVTLRFDVLGVSLVKQDNRPTERGFLIDIHAVDAAPPGTNVATLDDDYTVSFIPGNRDILVQFNSFQDTLFIQFDLVHDLTSEGPEAFQLQSTNNATGPVFSPPNEVTVFSSIFVIIADSESDDVVGFESNNYTVSEVDSFVEICVVVTNPPANQTFLPENVLLFFIDVVPAPIGEPNVESDFFGAVLNNTVRRACFIVNIICNDIVEESETFEVVIADILTTEIALYPSVDPRTAVVTITDATLSNVGVPFSNSLYPYVDILDGVVLFGNIDDGATFIGTLTTPYILYGNSYHDVYVGSNGQISFGRGTSCCCNRSFPTFPPLVTAFWNDIDLEIGGVVFHRVINSGSELDDLRGSLRTVAGNVCRQFRPTSAAVITFVQVSASNGSSEINNTFQVILMTDGATSYTVFLYNSMNWGDDDDTVIGFNDGDRFSTQQCFSAFSTVRNLSASSNVNISGVYVFSSDSVLVDVLCFANYSCTGPTVASTGVSPRECCLERGLSYDVCGQCYICNVYGWEEPEFQAVESEEPYLLSIGVTKGSLALEEGLVIEQTFSVQHTGGTATPGVSIFNGDFSFTPGTTSLNFRQRNSSVLVTLRTDGIALEDPETIELTLQSSAIPFPCTHYFIQDTITITIMDIDTVRVFMNASVAVESQRLLRLRVEKTGTIANILTIALELLTVADATELGLVLPDDIPSDDSSSPNRAESGPGNDFMSSATILATFPSDEDINVFICPIQDVFVEVIDDEVNEATAQYFLAHLNRTVTMGSAVNLSNILIDQPLVTCVILDDDAISIQFGEEQYSTSEELEAVNVTLTKNTVSEQTFSLNITSSDSSLDDIDLETIGPVVFPPDQQTLSVTIPLVNDDETEGTETHLLRIVQDPNGPQFNASNRQQATIVIRDDEVVGCRGSDVPVRLQGGPSEREGRVEYCSEDEWAPICSGSLTLGDAGKICQTLNFTNGVDEVRSSASLRIVVDTYLENFTCSEANCSSACCFSRTTSCLQTTAVVCRCNNGTNRLIDGISDTYDEVQECVAGEWFPVCAEFWDSRDGNVVCGHSQQNTSNSVRDTAIVTSFGTINDTSFVRRQCEGTEGRLNECQQLSSDPVCNAGSAYVLCHDLPEPQRQCNNSDIRLVNGSTNETGRVEICYDGVWGTVCSHGWDDSDATVACQQLQMGFLTGNVSTDHSPGGGPILLSNVSCNGTEDSLWNCSSLGVGVHDCIDHSLDAGVICQGPPISSSVGASSSISTVAPTSAPLSAGALAGIGVAAGVLGLVVLLCLVLIIWTSYRTGKHKHQRPVRFTLRTVAPDAVTLKNRFSQYCENISDDLLIEHTSLRLLDVLGQGEFGVVYKAHLITPSSNILRRMSGYRKMNRQSKTALEVAVKTLHAFFSDKDVAALMDEFLRMKDFDHHNVLSILGVCVDAGAAPYIVMPYMSNGSLLEFVRDKRDTFVIADPLDTNLSFMTTKMINICLQICKGMEYLASNNVIHRDLAARNCMISGDWVVKVADFGLSMTGYANTYTKLKKEADTKLPIKWMSPEAFDLDKFSEKSDVWSFGVTCWEVYSGGSTPYPGMNDPKTLVDFIHGGGRLDKPTSITCSDEMYALLLSCWDEDMQTRPSFSQLVERIEMVLGMVTGYVQLAPAPLQQLKASDDNDDQDDGDSETVDSYKPFQESDRGSITSGEGSLSVYDVTTTDSNAGAAETTM